MIFNTLAPFTPPIKPNQGKTNHHPEWLAEAGKQPFSEKGGLDRVLNAGRAEGHASAQLVFSTLNLEDKELDKHVVYLVDDSEIDEDTAAVGTLKNREYVVVGDSCEFVAAGRVNLFWMKNRVKI